MIKNFMKYYKPYISLLIGVIAGTFIMSGLDLIFPVVVRNLINQVLPEHDMDRLLIGSALLLVLYTLDFAIRFAVQYYGHVMSASIEHDMRRDLFAHIEKLSFHYFDNEKTGQLLSRITSDVTEVSELSFRGPNDVLLCGVIMIGTLVIMLFMNWKLALLIGTLLVIKTVQTVDVNRKMKAAFRKNRAKAGEVSARAEESLSGIRLVKAFAKEAFELSRFEDVSRELRNTRFKSNKLVAYFSGGINFFTNFINVAVILAGGFMISDGTLTVADFVAFLLYVNIFMKPVFRLTILAEVYQRGMAGFHRFEEIMNTQPSIRDPEHPVSAEAVQGNITFSHMSFGYDPNRMILHDLTFDIPAGQTIAFVGETGAGKSTLVSLLLRFYEPQQGKILLDSHELASYRQQDLRRSMGIVQQDVFLFGDTIAENIGYGKEGATKEEIRQAAKLAAADEFIRELPHGYDTKVGERGVKLSGGQKQRIAIARVFLKNPPVVILDEATSALDTQTEKLIQVTLNELARDRTTIIIAHRLSTVRNADRIVVLDQGRVIEEGTHDELIARKGKYYSLYQAQRKKTTYEKLFGKSEGTKDQAVDK
ncbi:MAG: ABC transporter ATP-binding protein [Dialister sp.]|nr:ABC transporter ATP-binding protein [Dialister sp.]